MDQNPEDYEFSEEEGEMLGLENDPIVPEEEFSFEQENVPPVQNKTAHRVTSEPKNETNPMTMSESNPSRVLNMAGDVPVQLAAVLARKPVTVKDLLELKMGEVVDFNRFPNEAIDLVANGKILAKGELVEIDGKLGVRVIKVFD